MTGAPQNALYWVTSFRFLRQSSSSAVAYMPKGTGLPCAPHLADIGRRVDPPVLRARKPYHTRLKAPCDCNVLRH
jgi:hypothetical protein